MKISSFLSNSFGVFKKQPVLAKMALLFPLALLLPVVMIIAAALVVMLGGGTAVKCIAAVFIILFVLLMLGLVFFMSPVLLACSINGSRIALTDEKKLTFKELYQASSGYIWRLLGAMVLQILIVLPFALIFSFVFSAAFRTVDLTVRTILTALFMTPLYLTIGLFFNYWGIAIVLENLKVGEAFKRAWSFVTAHFGKALAIDALLYLVTYIPNIALSLLPRILSGNAIQTAMMGQMSAITRLFEGMGGAVMVVVGVIVYYLFMVFSMLISIYGAATRVQLFLAVNPAPQVEVAAESPATPSDDAQPQA